MYTGGVQYYNNNSSLGWAYTRIGVRIVTTVKLRAHVLMVLKTAICIYYNTTIELCGSTAYSVLYQYRTTESTNTAH